MVNMVFFINNELSIYVKKSIIESEDILFTNFNILFTIIHELFHAYHAKIILDNNDDFYTNYLKGIYALYVEYYNYKTDLDKLNDLNNKSYRYDIRCARRGYEDISEYHTNILSYELILNLIDNYPEFSIIYKSYSANYLLNIINIYSKPSYISPFEYYFKKVIPTNLNNFSFYNENNNKFINNVDEIFSFEEKLLYGLPLKKKETRVLSKLQF